MPAAEAALRLSSVSDSSALCSSDLLDPGFQWGQWNKGNISKQVKRGFDTGQEWRENSEGRPAWRCGLWVWWEGDGGRAP